MRRILLLLLLTVTFAAGCATTAAPEPRAWGERVRKDSDTFLVIGDSRRGFWIEPGAEPTDAEREAFVTRLRDEQPAFVVHAGDIARRGADTDAWTRFDEDFETLRDARVAMFPVLGNHEYLGRDSAAIDNYFARFPELGRRTQYARDFRGVRLLFLDSNVDEIGRLRAENQLDWLRRRLDEAAEDDTVRAVVLVTHHPAYSNRRMDGESAWVRDEVVPLAAQYAKVRALFSGHVHSYERFVVEGIPCVVTGGAGSPLQGLRDADDPDTRPDLYRGRRTFHYCRVRVGERIEVEVVMSDRRGGWEVVDRFEI